MSEDWTTLPLDLARQERPIPSLEERIRQNQELLSFAGRACRVPRPERSDSQAVPPQNLIAFFREFWSVNGLKAHPFSPYQHEVILTSSRFNPFVIVRSHYKGLSAHDLGPRQTNLERYRELREELDANLAQQQKHQQRLAENFRRYRDLQPKLEPIPEPKSRQQLETELAAAIQKIPDLNGNIGVETHTLLIPPKSTRVLVSQSYPLGREKDLYRLPNLRGKELPSYPYMSDQPRAQVWFKGEPVEPSSFADPESYATAIHEIIAHTVALLI